MKQLTLSQVIDGFLLACQAERLSAHTVADYSTTLRKFKAFVAENGMGDPPFEGIGPELIRHFLASLAKPQPRNLGAVKSAASKPLSKKTTLNYHTGLAALWTWAVADGVTTRHVLREVARPKPEKQAITPLTQGDVKALLGVCDWTRSYDRPGKRTCENRRPSALRDKTIIFLLLDTGMRSSELCGLTAKAIDLRNRRVWVMGKGDKERSLPISAETAKVLWRYMQERAEAKASDPLFVTRGEVPLNRKALLELLKSLGTRAGVEDVHPHRFRHTFAVNFLRNGGNVYELQMALGHTTLEMVKHYLSLAETDLETAHKEASPVAKWRLMAR